MEGMRPTIEAEVDEKGNIRPKEPVAGCDLEEATPRWVAPGGDDAPGTSAAERLRLDSASKLTARNVDRRAAA